MITEINNSYVYLDITTFLARKLGATWVQGRQEWRIPTNIHSLEELGNYVKQQKVEDLLSYLKDYRTNILSIKSKSDADGDKRLRPYQRVDAEFLQTSKNMAVFNEQRTGKTPTIIVATRDKGKRVIVCPSGLKLNWEKELGIWDNCKVYVSSGTPKQREALYNAFNADASGTLVISYETLRNDLEQIKNYQVVIMDEAHRLRNVKTKQSVSVQHLCKGAKYVYPMTGTPAVNHPVDVFGILKVLNPGLYSSYWNFVDRYFLQYDTPFGSKVGNLKEERKEEFQGLLDMISTQRKRKDVMQWLPKVETRVIELEQTPVYKKYATEIIDLNRLNETVVDNPLTQLLRLRQLAVDPELLSIKGDSPKTEFIKQYVEDNPGERIMVFSMFTSYLKRLHQELKGAEMLTGEQSTWEKSLAVENIQKGKSKVLLANIIAGGVGWTLDKVDTIIFTDISYNPMDNEQAKDRFIPVREWEFNDTKQVIYLQMQKSIDKVVKRAVDNKMDIVQLVNEYGLKKVLED